METQAFDELEQFEIVMAVGYARRLDREDEEPDRVPIRNRRVAREKEMNRC